MEYIKAQVTVLENIKLTKLPKTVLLFMIFIFKFMQPSEIA